MAEPKLIVYFCKHCGRRLRGTLAGCNARVTGEHTPVSVEVYTRADVIDRVRDEAGKLQDVGFSRRVGDVLIAAFPHDSGGEDPEIQDAAEGHPGVPAKFRCPVCKRAMSGPDESCNGAFTERGHPSRVKPEPIPASEKEPGEGIGARFRDFEKAVRVLFESKQVIDAVAEADAIKELYGWWGDFAGREANQRRRYAQLAKKPGVQESWKKDARERIAVVLAAAFSGPAATHPAGNELSDEDRARVQEIADIIGAVHAEGADPRFHEDDAGLLRQRADRKPKPHLPPADNGEAKELHAQEIEGVAADRKPSEESK